jgi:hypothetical protein
MSWAEFNLRLFSYKRVSEGELIKLRRLAWITYIAPNQDPKKLKGLKEERWWPIGKKETPKVSEAGRQRFLEEFKKYKEIKDLEKQLATKEHGRA